MSFFDKLKGGIGIENSKPTKTKNKIKAAKPKKKVEVSAPKVSEPQPKPQPKADPPRAEKLEPKKEKPQIEKPQAEGELSIDVYETKEDIVIQSTIGGIKPEDLDISIENDMVTIRGNREHLVEEEGKNYIYQECYWGSFARKIILPEEVDETGAKASMKNGILTLVMPKLHRIKKKKVAVKPEE